MAGIFMPIMSGRKDSHKDDNPYNNYNNNDNEEEQDDYGSTMVCRGPMTDLEGMRHVETRSMTLEQRGFFIDPLLSSSSSTTTKPPSVGKDESSLSSSAAAASNSEGLFLLGKNTKRRPLLLGSALHCRAIGVVGGGGSGSGSSSSSNGNSSDSNFLDCEQTVQDEQQQQQQPLQEEEDEVSTLVSFDVMGHVYVTPYQLWFVADHDSEYDLVIGGSCIPLHAVTDGDDYEDDDDNDDDDNDNDQEDTTDREKKEKEATTTATTTKSSSPGVYLQISEGGITELTLIPTTTTTAVEQDDSNHDNDNSSSSAQILFQALCRLVSMNPSTPEDDDDYCDDEYEGNGDLGGGDDMIWAKNPMSAFLGAEEEDEDEDDTYNNNGPRSAMLARLDQLLVVQPEFEILDGQFDDAE
jgi:hypothetical protein